MKLDSRTGQAADGAPLRGDPNTEAVRRYIRACDDGDMTAVDAALSPAATWWILARQHYDRDTIMAINRKRYPEQVERKSRILGIAAEGDRVAVEYETAEMTDGVMGYNIFHHLFVVRDGAIVSGREYLDPPPFANPFKQSQAAWFSRIPTTPGTALSEQTRSVVEAFLGEKKLSPELRTADFQWWLTGVGNHDLDRYLANLMKLMAAHPLGPVVRDDTKTIGMTVDGNRAAVEVARNLILADHDYIDHFHLLFILRDGKIAQMHEHTDVQAAIRGGLPVLEAVAMG